MFTDFCQLANIMAVSPAAEKAVLLAFKKAAKQDMKKYRITYGYTLPKNDGGKDHHKNSGRGGCSVSDVYGNVYRTQNAMARTYKIAPSQLVQRKKKNQFPFSHKTPDTRWVGKNRNIGIRVKPVFIYDE